MVSDSAAMYRGTIKRPVGFGEEDIERRAQTSDDTEKYSTSNAHVHFCSKTLTHTHTHILTLLQTHLGCPYTVTFTYSQSTLVTGTHPHMPSDSWNRPGQ